MYYLVVEFTDEKELAVIPDNWLDGTKCALWPPYKSSDRIMNAVTSSELPGQDWKSFPIRELYRNESYKRARKKLNIAELQSDLQSTASDQDESEQESYRRSKRKRRSNYNRFSSDDSSPESVPKEKKKNNRPTSGYTTRCPPLKLPTPQRNTQTPAADNHNYDAVNVLEQSTASSGSAVSTGSNSSTAATSYQQLSHNPSHARDVRIFTTLEKMRAEQQDQKQILNLILQKLDATVTRGVNATEDTLPENINFPLRSSEEVADLESELKDKSVFKAVVNHLAIFGGKNLKQTVFRLLQETLTNPLAKQYNWHGKKHKSPFGNLQLVAAFYKCIQRNVSTKTATMKEMEDVIKDWLRGAGDRDGGRKRRASVPLPQVDTEIEDQ